MRTTRVGQRARKKEEEIRKHEWKKEEVWGLNEDRLEGEDEGREVDGGGKGGEREGKG